MPKVVYQDYLDTVSRAVMDGDIATMMNHVALPFMLSTRDHHVVATCPEEMDLIISDIRSNLRSRNVTVYRRTCLDADYFPGTRNMIVGWHRTEAFNKDGPVMPGHKVCMTLLLIGGQWKALWQDADTDNSVVPMLNADFSEAQAMATRMKQFAGNDRRPPMKGPTQ